MAEFSAVPRSDNQARKAVNAALAATPRGASFGRLTEPAVWLAGCQSAVPASTPQNVQVMVFEGEHGIAQRTFEEVGLSAYAPEADAEQAEEIARGFGPVQSLAQRYGARVDTLHCEASAPIDESDAMSSEVFTASLEAGKAAADRAADAGVDLAIPAEHGVGGTTVAAVIMGSLTSTEPVAIVGPGSGTTDAMWKTKVGVIRDAMFRARNLDMLELAQAASSPSFVAMLGFIAQCAVRRTPVLIDGPFAATAAALAERIAPGTREWLYATSVSAEPAHVLALQDLELIPLLSLEMRNGLGLGALSALPLIASGVELAADQVAVTDSADEPHEPEPRDDAQD